MMKWSHLIKCECRVFGRQTSDSHSILEEVKEDLLVKFPRFVYSEPMHEYLPLLEDEVDEAERNGMMVSFTNAWTNNKTMAHIVCYSYVFSMQCTSQGEALDMCERIESEMPEQFTSIQIHSSAWLDRNPH